MCWRRGSCKRPHSKGGDKRRGGNERLESSAVAEWGRHNFFFMFLLLQCGGMGGYEVKWLSDGEIQAFCFSFSYFIQVRCHQNLDKKKRRELFP